MFQRPSTDSHDFARRELRRHEVSADDLRTIDAYWRAANYLTVGQIYLQDNPLCASRCGPSTSSRACSATGARRPGSTWSTCISTGSSASAMPNVIFLAGPGHGGPAVLANVYLEGTYSEIYPAGHATTPPACGGSSGSSRRPAACRAT